MAVFLLFVVAFSAINASGIDFSEGRRRNEKKDHHASMSTGRFEGDIELMPEQEDVINSQINGVNTPDGVQGKVQKSLSYRWPDAVVPYVITEGIADEEALLQRAMRHWEIRTCIRFVERTDEDHYINFIRDSGCWSYVGLISSFNNGQDISIGHGCEWLDIVVHEIGHAIGFFHEQSRPDRDEYIVVHLDNVAEWAVNNFNKYTTNTIETHQVPYDIASVMHYSATAFSTNGSPTITVAEGNSQDPATLGAAQGLTCGDIELANIAYSCADRDDWSEYECDEEEEGVNYEYEEIDISGSHNARVQITYGQEGDREENYFVRDDEGSDVSVAVDETFSVYCYSTQRIPESEYDATLLELTIDGEVVDGERVIYTSDVSYYEDSYNGENDGRPYIVAEITAQFGDDGKEVACTVETETDREVAAPRASATLRVQCPGIQFKCGDECSDDMDMRCNGEEECPSGTDEDDCDDICFTTFSHDDADDVGEFVSHEGDDDGSDGVNYDNNVNCFTLIRAPVGKVVLLEFVEFALEENRECRYDAVELFEGLSHLDGPPFAKLCGHEVPRPFVSRGRELLVYFHSDESVTDAGFLARYEFVDARDGGGNMTGIVEAFAGAFNGFVDFRVPDDVDTWRVILRFDRKLRSLKVTGTCDAVVTRKQKKGTVWTIVNKRDRGHIGRGQFLYFEFTAITSPNRNQKGARAFVDFQGRGGGRGRN